MTGEANQERQAQSVRLALAAIAAMVLVACADPSAPAADQPPIVPPSPSLALEGDVRPPEVFSRHIVVLRDDVASAHITSAALVTTFGGLRFYVYETALKGFAVANLPAGAVEALRLHSLVVHVEEDSLVMPGQSVQALPVPRDTGLYLLDRIDQRYLPLDHQYVYTPTGAGVHIYIVDSGVNGEHQEYIGRTGNGAAFIKWSSNPNPYHDQTGHGTAVAGAAAGGAWA